jgi:hypothetical protein
MKLGSLNTLDFNGICDIFKHHIQYSFLRLLFFMTGNKELQILGPLTGFLSSWPYIQVMDFRGVHKDKNTAYW